MDLHKLHADEYKAVRRPALVEVGEAAYLAIAGEGSPAGELFQQSVQALYGVAYKLRSFKKAAGTDYAVAKLEGLWWTEDDSDSFLEQPQETWRWKLLIRVPDFVQDADVQKTVDALVRAQKPGPLQEVRLERFTEGLCVQMLHIGPYASETNTLVEMWAYCNEQGLELRGRHHEIYLSDPNRVAPEKLRTILRHPVGRPATRPEAPLHLPPGMNFA